MPLVRKAPRGGAIVVRALAFATPDGSQWAAGVDAGGLALLAGVAGAAGAPVRAAVTWEADGCDARRVRWRLRGDGIALTAVAVDQPTPAAGDEGSPTPAGGRAADAVRPDGDGVQQLCRVTGSLGGSEVDCIGVGTELSGVAEVGSIRGFGGWLSDARAVALLAVRAGSEQNHQRDRVAATVFDDDGWLVSDDPRLSTTYDANGDPIRTTLELWISDGERELVRRAAGEVDGEALVAQADGGSLEVLPVRCHSHGDDGTGVYLLASLSEGA